LRAEIDGEQIAVSGDLSETDWQQPARFRSCCERYGYWGLALLEAIVRQADHQVSALAVV
jgi:CRISPR-associated endonuclease/helicase Cas3